MMEDFDALNQKMQQPQKHTRTHKPRNKSKLQQPDPARIPIKNKRKLNFLTQLHHGQYKITPTKIKNMEQLKIHYAQPLLELQGQTKLITTDHPEYADDTILTLDPTNIQEIITPLRNYQRITEGRQIPIQWKNRNTNPVKTAQIQKCTHATI